MSRKKKPSEHLPTSDEMRDRSMKIIEAITDRADTERSADAALIAKIEADPKYAERFLAGKETTLKPPEPELASFCLAPGILDQLQSLGVDRGLLERFSHIAGGGDLPIRESSKPIVLLALVAVIAGVLISAGIGYQWGAKSVVSADQPVTAEDESGLRSQRELASKLANETRRADDAQSSINNLQLNFAHEAERADKLHIELEHWKTYAEETKDYYEKRLHGGFDK